MKIGTIGTGIIVDTFLDAVKRVDNLECTAVYSRKEETAAAFAEKHEIGTHYTDLNMMLNDSDVDTIYIASPNSLHFEQAYRALKHGKHVICEKPFTATLKEADQLIQYAETHSLMLFEAIKNINFPNFHLVKEHLEEIGDVKFIHCNYSKYSSRYDALKNGDTPNVFNPEFAGGALADLNIYNIHFVMKLFGQPMSAEYTANIHKNGIDTSGVAVLKYPDFIAECVAGKDARSLNFVIIQGEKGYIHVKNGANNCDEVILNTSSGEYHLNNQTSDNDMYYEARLFAKIFRERDFETCRIMLEHSRAVMDVYESARHSAGIIFPADEPS